MREELEKLIGGYLKLKDDVAYYSGGEEAGNAEIGRKAREIVDRLPAILVALTERASMAAEIERLRGLVEELADDLEVEVQDRWGYDERLAHKLKRDMDVIVRARAALATLRETNDA